MAMAVTTTKARRKTASPIPDAVSLERFFGGRDHRNGEDLLRELISEVQGLRADLNRGRAPSVDSLSDALLPVLAASVADKAFSAREVIQHAALVDGLLRAALAAAGLVNARKLGKWLRAIEGRALAGLRLERIGLDRDGIIWRVWRV
jgi:hypothetical protein